MTDLNKETRLYENGLWDALDREIVDYVLEHPPVQISQEAYGASADGCNPVPDGIDVPPDGVDVQAPTWLGRYEDLSSPGKIVFHRDRIARAFWHAAHHLQVPKIGRQPLCRSVAFMVLAHERFHHFCDELSRVSE